MVFLFRWLAVLGSSKTLWGSRSWPAPVTWVIAAFGRKGMIVSLWVPDIRSRC
jgi:hypothetical protein